MSSRNILLANITFGWLKFIVKTIMFLYSHELDLTTAFEDANFLSGRYSLSSHVAYYVVG